MGKRQAAANQIITDYCVKHRGDRERITGLVMRGYVEFEIDTVNQATFYSYFGAEKETVIFVDGFNCSPDGLRSKEQGEVASAQDIQP